MTEYRIPFNKPFVAGKELYHVARAVLDGHTSGDGPYGKRCESFLSQLLGIPHTLVTTSCTAALDMAALACGVGEGDEVILPTFTAPGSANAFLNRGARIVLCDVRDDSFTLDLDQAAALVTERTRAIVPRHYAGVSPDMDGLMALAGRNDILIIEDAAEAFNAKYLDRSLGSVGHVGALSFHETKDFSCGEGGAFLTHDRGLFEQAEIIREKGTNRSQFFRGQVDKYTWVAVGSSYVPSDLLCAFLYGQLEQLEPVTAKRRTLYEQYSSRLSPLAEEGRLTLPTIPPECRSNFHRFHVLLSSQEDRDALIQHLRSDGIMAVVHFFPLHLSAMGRKLGGQPGQFPVAESVSRRILRLPFFFELSVDEADLVCDSILRFFRERGAC